jgi:hypothetical protein
MKKILVRVCIVIIALIVIAALAIHFFLDGAVKSGVESVGSKMTKVDVSWTACISRCFRAREKSPA